MWIHHGVHVFPIMNPLPLWGCEAGKREQWKLYLVATAAGREMQRRQAVVEVQRYREKFQAGAASTPFLAFCPEPLNPACLPTGSNSFFSKINKCALMSLFLYKLLFNYYNIGTYIESKNASPPGDYQMKSGLPRVPPLLPPPNHLLNWLSFLLSFDQLLAIILKSSRKPFVILIYLIVIYITLVDFQTMGYSVIYFSQLCLH